MQALLLDPAPSLDWDKLRPILDQAMLRLKQADREAILLRYFQNRPLAEIGTSLASTKMPPACASSERWTSSTPSWFAAA